MENATKALMIASGVLIGVMIISLGISLYASLSGYVESSQEDMEVKKLQQFNMQFTKYINYNEETNENEFILTIQDVVTAANIAYENNTKYELTEQTGNNYYVTINIRNRSANLERDINSISAQLLADNLTDDSGQVKQYICKPEDVEFNELTGRVFQVTFHEMP